MFGAKSFGENIFGEQMFGEFFIKSPKISVNNFGEKEFWNFPPKSSFSRSLVVMQFQCFRGWDTPFFFFQNECDEGSIALEVDDEQYLCCIMLSSIDY